MNILFLVFGILDIGAGAILTLGEINMLSGIANYVGIFLILKGIWTLVMSLG